MQKPHAVSSAALIYGPDAHYLDHLAPICYFLQIPLIVSDEAVFELAQKFYPTLHTSFIETGDLSEHIIKNFDVLFYCTPRILFDDVFFLAQKLHNKKIYTIWCPHGNSDKGRDSYFMEALDKEEFACVYGKKMVEFLKEKHAFSQLKMHIVIGNLRHHFYQKNKTLFDSLLQQNVMRKLRSAEKTILYAPTWNDTERSSSFRKAIPHLIENLPTTCNLIIKLHPNVLLESDPIDLSLIWKYEDNPGVLFLVDFPLIYPLLESVDVYVGDMSSIGYDFLIFNKPMFFLNQNRKDPNKDLSAYLFRCGITVAEEDYRYIYSLIEEHYPMDEKKFALIRKQVYQYTFDESVTPEDVKKSFHLLCERLPDRELRFF